MSGWHWPTVHACTPWSEVVARPSCRRLVCASAPPCVRTRCVPGALMRADVTRPGPGSPHTRDLSPGLAWLGSRGNAARCLWSHETSPGPPARFRGTQQCVWFPCLCSRASMSHISLIADVCAPGPRCGSGLPFSPRTDDRDRVSRVCWPYAHLWTHACLRPLPRVSSGCRFSVNIKSLCVQTRVPHHLRGVNVFPPVPLVRIPLLGHVLCHTESLSC